MELHGALHMGVTIDPRVHPRHGSGLSQDLSQVPLSRAFVSLEPCFIQTIARARNLPMATNFQTGYILYKEGLPASLGRCESFSPEKRFGLSLVTR